MKKIIMIEKDKMSDISKRNIRIDDDLLIIDGEIIGGILFKKEIEIDPILPLYYEYIFVTDEY